MVVEAYRISYVLEISVFNSGIRSGGTEDTIEPSLVPSIKVILAELCTLYLELPHRAYTLLLCLSITFHLWSERLLHSIQGCFDCLSSICKEKIALVLVSALYSETKDWQTHQSLNGFLVKLRLPIDYVVPGSSQFLYCF